MTKILEGKLVNMRISEELFEKFNDIITKKALNRSALLRLWIEKFVAENQE